MDLEKMVAPVSSKRGLVISPPIRVDGDYISIPRDSFDPQDLRANLLFWDKLDWPVNYFVGFDISPEVRFLTEAGVLQRTPGSIIEYKSAAQYLRAAHIESFRQLDRQQPGIWSVSRGVNSILFCDKDLEVGRGALVRLVGALPVPHKEVPLEDILAFREKRGDELLATRFQIERIYQRVVNAGDGDLALKTEIEALQSAVLDQMRVSREAPFRFRLADLSANLNLAPVGISALAAMALDLPLIPSLVAGVSAGLTINLSAGLKGRQPQATPYQYVTSYHREVF